MRLDLRRTQYRGSAWEELSTSQIFFVMRKQALPCILVWCDVALSFTPSEAFPTVTGGCAMQEKFSNESFQVMQDIGTAGLAQTLTRSVGVKAEG